MKGPISIIQEIPKDKRKIIFWVIMIILALTLSGFYIKYIQKKVIDISIDKTKEEMEAHSLEEIIDKIREIEIPKIEMPKFDQESLQELQRMMEEMPEEEIEENLEEPLKENNNQPAE